MKKGEPRPSIEVPGVIRVCRGYVHIESSDVGTIVVEKQAIPHYLAPQRTPEASFPACDWNLRRSRDRSPAPTLSPALAEYFSILGFMIVVLTLYVQTCNRFNRMSEKRKRADDLGGAAPSETVKKKQKRGFTVGPQNLPDGAYKRKSEPNSVA